MGKKQSVYKMSLFILTAVIILGSYLLLRYQYRVAEEFPFAQEVVLIVMGTLMTILITAMLLNKQTEVELTKELNLRYIDLKSEQYFTIINKIELIISKASLTEQDRLVLEFFSHRLAIVASIPVLTEFSHFISSLSKSITDDELSQRESDDISRALAKLTVSMRADLIGLMDKEQNCPEDMLNKIILSNANQAITHFNTTE